jgi:hypothetical protein
MGASVNDTIHIKIQMVKLWQERRVGDDLIDLGVALADPSIKLQEKKQKMREELQHFTNSFQCLATSAPLGHPWYSLPSSYDSNCPDVSKFEVCVSEY